MPNNGLGTLLLIFDHQHFGYVPVLVHRLSKIQIDPIKKAGKKTPKFIKK